MRIRKMIHIGGEVTPLNEKQLRILENMKDTDWQPNFTKISERMGVPVSTIFDNWTRMKEHLQADIYINVEGWTLEGEEDG